MDTATRPPPMAPHHRGRATVGRLPAFDTFHTITNLTGWQEGIFSILLVTPCVSARCGEPVKKCTEQKANNDKSPTQPCGLVGQFYLSCGSLVACSRTMIEAELFSQRGLLERLVVGNRDGGHRHTPQIHHRERSGLRTVVSFANYSQKNPQGVLRHELGHITYPTSSHHTRRRPSTHSES